MENFSLVYFIHVIIYRGKDSLQLKAFNLMDSFYHGIDRIPFIVAINLLNEIILLIILIKLIIRRLI